MQAASQTLAEKGLQTFAERRLRGQYQNLAACVKRFGDGFQIGLETLRPMYQERPPGVGRRCRGGDVFPA